MSLNAGGAFVELIPQIARDFERQAAYQLENSLTGVSKGLGDKMGKILGGAIAVGGGVALGAGLKSFFSGAISEATEASKVMAQTDAVIRSTGGAAGFSADQFGELATKLSNLTGIDDEVIQQGENVLATFTNIKGLNFADATASAVDMSKALGTDLQGSVIQLGKALNDPIKGISALQRVGVSFTQQQKDQIAALVATGNQMEAQRVILAEVQKEFGGTAAAIATPWEKLGVAWKNLEEDFGTALQPALSALAPALGSIVTAIAPVVTSLGQALGPAITALAPVIAILAPPLAQIVGLLGQILVPIANLVVSLAPIVGMFLQLASIVLSALMPAIQPLISTLDDFVGIIAQALQPVIAALVPILRENAGVYVQLVQALLPLLPALAQLLASLLPILPPLLELATLQLRLIGLLAPVIAFVAELAAVLITKLAGAITAVVGFVRDDLIGWFEKLPGRVGGAIDAVVGFVTGLPGRIGGALYNVFEPLWEGFKHFINFLIRGWNSLHFDIPEFDTHIPGVGKIGGGELRVPQIPYLSKGGDVIDAGEAFIAEKGPELVNLPRGARVTPLERSNLAELAPTGTDGPRVIEVPVYIDGREVARASAPYGPGADRRYRRSRQ